MELNKAVQFFLNTYFQKRKYSTRTYQYYGIELNHFYHFLQLRGSINVIADVDEKIITEYLNERSTTLSLSKLTMIASHLKQFFHFLKREGIVETDPTLFIRDTPVRTIIKNKELIDWETMLSGLSDNLKRLGKEQYKFQTVIESRGQKEWELFNELKRRLNRSERLLEEVIESKSEFTSNFIKEILPVVDGLEEAINSMNSTPKIKQKKTFLNRLASGKTTTMDLSEFTEGLRLIKERLIQILHKANVAAIKSIGETFNPHEHIAIAVEARDDVQENTIIRELLKGYRQGDVVIRLAEVVVSRRN